MVAAALRGADERWLLHRRPAHKEHGGLWEFPGGKVEAGETPANALVRELAEELGISCGAGALRPAAFAQDRVASRLPPTVILLYTLADWDGTPRAVEPGGRVAWFAPAQIARLERPPLDRDLCRALFGADERR